MGIIKRGILGGFSGKVANVVGTSWKGRAVIKSLPLSVANPKTAGQVKQRTKFSTISSYASGILSIWVKPLWDRFAGNISGYNDFVSVNIEFVSDSGVIDYTALKMSEGNLHPSDIVNLAGGTAGSSSVNVGCLTDDGQNGLPTDVRYCICVDRLSGEPRTVNVDTVRSEGTVEMLFSPPLTAGEELVFYTGMLREDGSEVSNSEYSFLSVS